MMYTIARKSSPSRRLNLTVVIWITLIKGKPEERQGKKQCRGRHRQQAPTKGQRGFAIAIIG
jgi:hypothetical protein